MISPSLVLKQNSGVRLQLHMIVYLITTMGSVMLIVVDDSGRCTPISTMCIVYMSINRDTLEMREILDDVVPPESKF